MAAFSPAFLEAFRVVVGEEGGYGCDRRDAGDWSGGNVGLGVLRGTKYGISAASFPTLDIQSITLDQARAIYRVRYWNKIAGDSLAPGLALLLFDAAVNQGVEFAARALQESLLFNAPDGVIGPLTVRTARLFCATKSALSGVLIAVGVERALGYARDHDESYFGRGWFTRLLRVFSRAQSMTGDFHA